MYFSLVVVSWDHSMELVVKKEPEAYRKFILLIEAKSAVKLH